GPRAIGVQRAHARADRLYAAAVRALPESDGLGEHQLRRLALWSRLLQAPPPPEVRARLRGAERRARPARQRALRRYAAPAGAGLGVGPRPAAALRRRADRRDRPGAARQILAALSRAARPGPHTVRDDPVCRRGGLLRSGRRDARRPAAVRRY